MADSNRMPELSALHDSDVPFACSMLGVDETEVRRLEELGCRFVVDHRVVFGKLNSVLLVFTRGYVDRISIDVGVRL